MPATHTPSRQTRAAPRRPILYTRQLHRSSNGTGSDSDSSQTKARTGCPSKPRCSLPPHTEALALRSHPSTCDANQSNKFCVNCEQILRTSARLPSLARRKAAQAAFRPFVRRNGASTYSPSHTEFPRPGASTNSPSNTESPGQEPLPTVLSLSH